MSLPPVLDSTSEPDDSGNFKYRGQKLFLTYKEHLEKEWLQTNLEEITRRSFKFYRAAHEMGNKIVPYPHTHVLIHFDKEWKSNDCRALDLDVELGEGNSSRVETIHPHWRPVKTSTHWRNCLGYVAKEDPENTDLLKETSLIDGIYSCASKTEALRKYATSPGQALGILAIYATRPREVPECNLPDYPWQTKTFELLKTKPHHRHIHWFYDPVGDTGKSYFAYYSQINQLAHHVTEVGTIRDFATNIVNALDNGWDGNCLIFDLSRSDASSDHLYKAIEQAKNGAITAVKYSGTTVCFKKPHVLIFANFLPYRKALSADRWRIHYITDDRDLEAPIIRDRNDPPDPEPDPILSYTDPADTFAYFHSRETSDKTEVRAGSDNPRSPSGIDTKSPSVTPPVNTVAAPTGAGLTLSKPAPDSLARELAPSEISAAEAIGLAPQTLAVIDDLLG